MKEVLIQMLEIYLPNGRDWMDYQLTKSNPYTFHHIKEVRNGGKTIISNGAILTNNAHRYLNYLDYKHKYIYRELNGMFFELNRSFKPPTDEYFEEVEKVLKKVKDEDTHKKRFS